MRLLFLFGFLIWEALASSVTAQSFTGPENFGRVNSASIDQASGLAMGIRNPQIVWMHNDQTDGRVFAVGTNGMLLATFSLNFPVEDLEDLAVTPSPSGGSHLYIGDLGNNFEGRETVRVLRAPEPLVDPAWSAAPRVASLAGVEVFTLRYPDGKYNAEPLLVDPGAGKLHLLTKSGGNARIYTADLNALAPGGTNLLRFDGEIYFPWLTSGTISSDGQLLALRSAGRAALWKRSSGETALDALRRPGVAIPVVGPPEEANGEGITFAPGNAGYFTISEGIEPPLNFFRRINPGQASAEWLGPDDLTRGSWRGGYGLEGHTLQGDTTMLPGYAQVSFSEAQTWVWNGSTGDPSAVERSSGSGRLAACWYSPQSLSVRVTFTDGLAHEAAFYLLDWDTHDRSQQVDVLDANNGAILHSQQIGNFHSGRYLSFLLRGDVLVRFTRLNGFNAVLSGIFFDSPGSAPATVVPPEITPNGGNFTGPITVSMSAAAGASIYFTLDQTLPTTNSTRYTGPFQLDSTATISARAVFNGVESSPRTATFQITSPSNTGGVRFLGFDTATMGNWRGVYGGTGFWVFEDWKSLPAGCQITAAGQNTHIWAYNVADMAALQKYSSPSRIASCFYSASGFELDIQGPAGTQRKLALYFLDWDGADRVQRVQLFNSSSRELLDTREVQAFKNGSYLIWEISAGVKVRISRTKGPNAVLSGVFLD